MGWKDDARRLIIGEKVQLETFEGYWIRPKKWSIQAKDEINAVQRRIQKGIDKKALMSVYAKSKGKNYSEEELLEKISPEELGAFLDSNSLEAKDFVEIKLKYGIAEHNFEGAKVKDLAHDILEYEDIAIEMLKIVEDFNRPLAKKTSPISGMSQNGSTEEPVLNTEISTQTDENQQN